MSPPTTRMAAKKLNWKPKATRQTFRDFRGEKRPEKRAPRKRPRKKAGGVYVRLCIARMFPKFPVEVEVLSSDDIYRYSSYI